MRMQNSIKKMAYSGVVLLHALAWLLALAGLASTQNKCADMDAFPARDSLFAPQLGSDCEKFFRLPWFIWAVNFLPVIMSVGAILKPCIFGVGNTALWAMVTVLNILMANSFNNARDSSGVSGELKDRVLVTLSGFAIMAATGLILMLLHGLIQDDKDTTESHEVTGGKMAEHRDVHDSAAPLAVVRPVEHPATAL